MALIYDFHDLYMKSMCWGTAHSDAVDYQYFTKTNSMML